MREQAYAQLDRWVRYTPHAAPRGLRETMSALEVDQSGEIGHVHHSKRQVLLDFMNHLKSNGYLKFSYPMPNQERGEGWMMFHTNHCRMNSSRILRHENGDKLRNSTSYLEL